MEPSSFYGRRRPSRRMPGSLPNAGQSAAGRPAFAVLSQAAHCAVSARGVPLARGAGAMRFSRLTLAFAALFIGAAGLPAHAADPALDCAYLGGVYSGGVCRMTMPADNAGSGPSAMAAEWLWLDEDWRLTAGDLAIGGSGAPWSAFIYNAARAGDVRRFENAGTGALTLSGGSAEGAWAIAHGALDAEAVFVNAGGGRFRIEGGSGKDAEGLNTLARTTGSTPGGAASARIENGSGVFEIAGGTGEGAQGVNVLAKGAGASAQIVNAADFSVEGGDGGALSAGIYALAAQGGSAGIENGKNARFDVTGGRAGAGIHYLAEGFDGADEVVIENQGTFAAAGGEGAAGHGIAVGANGSGSLVIRNAGTLTLEGSASGAHGIALLGASGGRAVIENQAGATLNLLGGTGIGAGSGIGMLSDGTAAGGGIRNEGVLRINENGIGAFLPSGVVSGGVLCENRAGATVEAEARALFSGKTTIVSEAIPISIYSSESGMRAETLESYRGEHAQSEWTLKSGWQSNAVWSSEGHLLITDIAEGTAEADALRKVFEAQYGKDAPIAFTGTGGSTAAEKPAFTMREVEALLEAGKAGAGSVITSEMLDLAGERFTLQGGSSGAQAPNNDAAALGFDFGFAGIRNAAGIRIEGGTLTLAGAHADAALLYGSRSDADAFGAPVIADSPVEVADGTLRLGISVLAGGQGRLGEVTLGASGRLLVENGRFAVQSIGGEREGSKRAGDASSAAAGRVEIGEKGTLVAGAFSAERTTNAGRFTVLSDVAFRRPGSGGTAAFVNAKGASAAFAGLDIEAGASVENNRDAVLAAETLHVRPGTLFWNKTGASTTVGSLVLEGSLRDFGALTVLDELSLQNGGHYELDAQSDIRGGLRVAEGGEAVLSERSSLTHLVLTAKEAASDEAGAEESTRAEAAAPAVTITDGEHRTAELALEAGTLRVDAGAKLAAGVLRGDALQGALHVAEGGSVLFSGFGAADRMAQAAKQQNGQNAQNASAFSNQESALLALGGSLHFEKDGRLTLGTFAEESPGAALSLGSSAAIVIDSRGLRGGPVFDLSGLLAAEDRLDAQPGLVRVEKGAAIYFGTPASAGNAASGSPIASLWGRHYLADASALSQADLSALESLEAFDETGRPLAVETGERGVFVTIGSDDIRDRGAGFAFAEGMNRLLDGRQNLESEWGDVRFLTHALAASPEAGAAATRRATDFAASAGLFSAALAPTEAVRNRLTHAETGAAGTDRQSFAFRLDRLDFDRREDTGEAGALRADGSGVLLGADFRPRLEGAPGALVLGGAYAQTDQSARGRESAATLNAKTHLFALHANASLRSDAPRRAHSDVFSAISDVPAFSLGFIHAETTGEASMRALLPLDGSFSADVERVFMTAEAPLFSAGPASLGFFGGIDWTHLSLSTVDLQASGLPAFRQKAGSADLWSLPLGIRAAYAKPLPFGLRLTASLEAGTRVFWGDRTVSLRTENASGSGGQNGESSPLGSFAERRTAGIAERFRHSIGLGLSLVGDGAALPVELSLDWRMEKGSGGFGQGDAQGTSGARLERESSWHAEARIRF